MSSPLLASGASLTRPPAKVPLFIDRFMSGLWTQRSQLRDATTPYYYAKSFAGSHYDSLIDGENTEISNRLTLIRRPGNSIYNSQSFTDVLSFYSFRLFDSTDEEIRVIVDTAAAVYNGTGPSTKDLVFTKSAGAGQTFFQYVANTLYMGDGVDQKQWVAQLATWQPQTIYQFGEIIQDSNGNLQQCLGTANRVINVTLSSNTLDLVATSYPSVGDTVGFAGFENATFLNNYAATGVNNHTMVVSSAAAPHIIGTFVAADYTSTLDDGCSYILDSEGQSGTLEPTWSTVLGDVSNDFFSGTTAWVNKGPAVQPWGSSGPSNAPVVSNVPTSSGLSAWAANTYYWPGQTIVVAGNVWQLTTSGTTDVAPPAFAGSPQTDGTAVWTKVGSAARIASHAYSVNDKIQVTYSFTATYTQYVFNGYTYTPQTVTQTYTYTNVFICSTAGASSAGADNSVAWPPGVGATTKDGTVTWTNAGSGVTRTGAATSSTNIGNSLLVSNHTQILGSNGYVQTVVGMGESGAVEPTWGVVVGQTKADNQTSWINGGPLVAANTGAWIYAYSFRSSVTLDTTTSSPLSAAIIKGPNEAISVSGAGPTDSQFDIVRLYRTVQDGATLFFIADIPVTTNTPWTFVDQSPDAGLAGSTQNELISAPIDHANDPPPTGIVNLTFHLNRIFGSVGNTVFWTNAPGESDGNAYTQFDPINFAIFPAQVTALTPINSVLYVWTKSDLYKLTGTGVSGDPILPDTFLPGIGLFSANCVSLNGSIFYIYTSDRQLLEGNPSTGLSQLGFPIGNLLERDFDPSLAYLTWHVNGSSDQALYMADGLTGWYRLNPAPAPEQGTMWSPKATIQTGPKAIQSTEVAAGVHYLLIGPSGTGHILRRDYSVNADDGTPYAAFATIGSVVLAQPGMWANIDYISTYAQAIGAHPTVSVLVDEVSNTLSPPFTTLATAEPEPPIYDISSTLYNDRWYLIQGGQPCAMQHMQIKFSWPAEDAANELDVFSITGSVVSE